MICKLLPSIPADSIRMEDSSSAPPPGLRQPVLLRREEVLAIGVLGYGGDVDVKSELHLIAGTVRRAFANRDCPSWRGPLNISESMRFRPKHQASWAR
jgi:hypothetical protein